MRELVSLNVKSLLTSYYEIMNVCGQMESSDVGKTKEYIGFRENVEDAYSPVFSYLQYTGYRKPVVTVPVELSPYLQLIQQFEISIVGSKHIDFEITKVEKELA